jgi:hypothetical protein
MTDDKALETMLKLETNGMGHADIAEHMKKAGYKGKRSGKPLSTAGVGYLLRRARGAQEAKEAAQKTVNNPVGLLPLETKVALAIKLLEDASIAPEERCTFARAVLKS